MVLGRSGTPLSLSASACWGVAGTLTWAGLRTPPSTSHTVGLGSYNQRLWGSGPATSTWLELGERPVWFAPAGVWGSWDMGHSVLTPGKSQQSRTSWYLRRRPHPPASVGPQPTMGGMTAALCLRPALRAIPSELRSREQHLTCVGLPSPSQFSPECLMNLEVNLAFPPLFIPYWVLVPWAVHCWGEEGLHTQASLAGDTGLCLLQLQSTRVALWPLRGRALFLQTPQSSRVGKADAGLSTWLSVGQGSRCGCRFSSHLF